MDLEGRTREFLREHEDLAPGLLRFMAPDARIDYAGLETLDRDGLERLLSVMHRNLRAIGFRGAVFEATTVVARRNLTIAEWTCTAERAAGPSAQVSGVHVIVWDREGQITNLTVYTDPEPLRRLAVGSHVLA